MHSTLRRIPAGAATAVPRVYEGAIEGLPSLYVRLSVGAAGESENTCMAIQDAIRHHEAGRLQDAQRLYRTILERDPRNSDALHLLGVLLGQVGRYDEAVAQIEQALVLVPESALYQSSLAQVHTRAGRLAQAAAILERVVAREPRSSQAFSDLGAVLQESGELERAVEAYRRAIAIDAGVAVVHFNLGTALKQQNRTAEALACVERAVAMDGSRAHFRMTLAGYYLEAGDPRAALESCLACLELEPRNLMALTFKAIALARLGDDAGATHIVDLEGLIQTRTLAVPKGFESISQFNDALAGYVLDHPTLKPDPINNATRFGRHTDNLLENPGGPIPALIECLDAAVVEFLRSLPRDPEHPYLAHRPGAFNYTMWSVVMDSQGHQLPHMHPQGWVSGVYYVKIPETMRRARSGQDGWIEFGRPLSELAGTLRPTVRTIRPEEGLLVLFPSYFYHQTIPFQSSEQRICVAFDAMPVFR